MAGLIEEIQRDATDESVPVVQLLRRMKIAAAKLKLPEIGAWVDHELNGYPNDQDVPEYRVIGGVPMIHSVGVGWRLWALGPEEKANTIFSVNFYKGSVAEVDGHASSTGLLLLTFPEWLERGTLAHLNRVDKIGLSVDRGKFRAVLNGVRNQALDWALAVEAKGVTGEGLSFTNEEAKAAQSVTTIIFHGPNSRYNQNSEDHSTNTVVQGDVFGDLRLNIREGVADTTIQTSLLEAVDMMEQSKNTSGFVSAYQRFIALAADHIQVIQWAIPLLTTYMTINP